MDLMEYQAKELFAKHDVPVTLGTVIENPAEAEDGAAELGGRVVVKAQVKAGGRGKAGGVKLAECPDRGRGPRAARSSGMDIKGHTVHRVLIAPAADIAEEYYLSFLVDRSNRAYLCIASVEGGVEIEEVARTNPDAVAKVSIDPQTGVDDAKAAEIVAATGFPADGRRPSGRPGQEAVGRLHRGGRQPGRGEPTGPSRRRQVSRRSTARSRSTRTQTSGTRTMPRFEDKTAADPLEQQAKDKGLNYVKLDGEVGIIGNGAGLVMSTLDVVAYAGEKHQRRQAGELPRHRRRRVGGGDGQRAADHHR